jgi:hypothetical protein
MTVCLAGFLAMPSLACLYPNTIYYLGYTIYYLGCASKSDTKGSVYMHILTMVRKRFIDACMDQYRVYRRSLKIVFNLNFLVKYLFTLSWYRRYYLKDVTLD